MAGDFLDNVQVCTFRAFALREEFFFYCEFVIQYAEFVFFFCET